MRIEFKNHPEIIAGISERADDSMIWWNKKPIDENIRKNREIFFKKQEIDPGRLVSGGLIHGASVAVVSEKDAGDYILDHDALITNVPNLFLNITAADCMPVFYFDPVSKSIGIAHAGWKGIMGGILEKTAVEMKKTYGVDPGNLTVAFGPHIRKCHYEVKEDVLDFYDEKNIEYREGKIFADITAEAEARLRRAGVKNILSDSPCTYCQAQRFFSARHNKYELLKSMAAYIGIKK